ncbi:MAG: uracil-DNA glycosylase [Candidatus Gracilibacteria bacterium]
MDVKIHESWKNQLKNEFEKPYFKELTEFVRKEYIGKKVYPSPQNIFRAFELCPFEKVRVVILGQDPYHGVGQANGLCFSVNDSVSLPPSLQNIFKEMHEDLAMPIRKIGNLDDWARQGVLLLNATLTVRAGQAGSHQKKGWEEFTDSVVALLNQKKEHLVFLLWGNYAKEKGKMIDTTRHLVLTAPHPSPFSAYSGFFGCKHFSKANEYLERCGEGSVKW